MKRDPYKHQEKYQAWKERIDEIGYIEGVSRKNSELILKYIFDMELGEMFLQEVQKVLEVLYD